MTDYTPDYKRKFECLVDHCKRQDAEIAKLRGEVNFMSMYSESTVWYWQGDGNDRLETLTCPVLIDPNTLLHLIGEK